jgi:DNA-binding response OmpR family regulator
MKMLIIEDDITVANFIKTGFEADSFTVDIALDGQQGSYIARTNHYDIIILDYSLPEKNGFTVLQEIRSKGQNTPIIFLSVIGDTNKKIRALQLGADDYLSKPFSFDELKARVRAIIRRPREIEESIIEMGNMKIDLDKHTLTPILLPPSHDIEKDRIPHTDCVQGPTAARSRDCEAEAVVSCCVTVSLCVRHGKHGGSARMVRFLENGAWS